VRDVDAAVKLIGTTAQLEFKEIQYDSNGKEVVDENGQPVWIPATAVDSTGATVPLTGYYLNPNAHVVIDQTTNEPRVAMQFNDEGAKLFDEITGRLVGKRLGIFLDTQMISAPTVKDRIPGGNAVIENIKLSDAQNLVVLLNAGALPVPLGEPIVREDIDPTLGADSIRKSLVAGAIGLALVIVFMVLYYRIPGVLASCALLIYGILMLGVFKLVPVTLTLAGIAGFILSIGMAVDANVLIFERMKEELRAGKTLAGAIEVGFVRAWPAIRDSNITTFISCVILYVIGSMLAEPRMMGFALTLGIGVALSMFSAITITRGFLRLFVGTNLETNLRLFGVDRPAQAPANKEQK
jgi:preprotein translocase subunit SecD